MYLESSTKVYTFSIFLRKYIGDINIWILTFSHLLILLITSYVTEDRANQTDQAVSTVTPIPPTNGEQSTLSNSNEEEQIAEIFELGM